MKRTLNFTISIPADVTLFDEQPQEEGDEETADMILPKIRERLSYLNATVNYVGSEAR
jgi:hypothetical protein